MTGEEFEKEILKILNERNLIAERLKHAGTHLTNCDYLVSNNMHNVKTPVFLIEVYGMEGEKNCKYKKEDCGAIIVDVIGSTNNLVRELRDKNEQFKKTKALEEKLSCLPTVLAVWLNDMFVENGRFPTYNNKEEHNGFIYQQIENMVYGSLNPTFYADPENPMCHKRVYEPKAFWYNDLESVSAFWFFSNDLYLNQRLYINPYALIGNHNFKELLKLSDEKIISQHSLADEVDIGSWRKKRNS